MSVSPFPPRDNISFSIWDRWTVYGHDAFTLSDFINAVKVRRRTADIVPSGAPCSFCGAL